MKTKLLILSIACLNLFQSAGQVNDTNTGANTTGAVRTVQETPAIQTSTQTSEATLNQRIEAESAANQKAIDSLATELKEVKSEVKEWEELVKRVLDNDTLDIVGELMIKDTVQIRQDCFNNGEIQVTALRTDSITKVDFVIRDGLFYKIRVYTASGDYFENNNIISVTNFTKRRTRDRLFKISGNEGINNCNAFIYAGGAFSYNAKTGRHYAPDSEEFSLSNNAKNRSLSVETGLNAFVDFRIYTDFLAVIDEESNGLIQSELSSKILLNSNNAPNSNLIFLQYVEPSLRVSKFDSKYKALIIDSTNIEAPETAGDLPSLEIDRTSLFQLSKYEVGLKLSLAKYYWNNNHLQLSAFGSFMWSDIIFSDSNALANTANLKTWGVELGWEVKQYRNFGFTGNLQLILSQRISEGTGFNDDRYAGIKNDRSYMFFVPSFEMYYFPINAEGDKIFLRFKIFDDWSTSGGGFNQFQIGYLARIKV